MSLHSGVCMLTIASTLDGSGFTPFIPIMLPMYHMQFLELHLCEIELHIHLQGSLEQFVQCAICVFFTVGHNDCII